MTQFDPEAHNAEVALRLYDRAADWDYEVDGVALDRGRIVPQRLNATLGGRGRRFYPSLPFPLKHPVVDGGVYDAEGRIVAIGAHLRDPLRNVPLPIPEPVRRDEPWRGNWVFGGRLSGHFGHFLTESLGRLWWLEETEAPRDAGLAYLWHSRLPPGHAVPASVRRQWPFIGRVLDLLGVPWEPRLVGGPVRADRLFVPSQLMALTSGPQVAGHPRFRRFVARLADHAEVAAGPRAASLYVSRSRLDAAHGRILLDAWLDEVFAAAGYAVVHPQDLPMEAQLSLYRSAERIVFSEGSAIHLFALVARPEQRVGIILRRFPAMARFLNQLRAAGLTEVTNFDAVAAVALPAARPDGAQPAFNLKYSDTVLDYPKLVRTLVAAGFLPSASAGATAPDAAHLPFADRATELAGVFAGLDFELVPRARVRERLKAMDRTEPMPAPGPRRG